MDLKKELLRTRSRNRVDKIVSYIGSDKDRFKQLVDLFLEGPYTVTQRASWPLSYSVENNPLLVKPHLRTLIKHLENSELHDAVKRNTLRLLQFVDIPTSFQGSIANICFLFLQNKKEPVAIRCFAMTVLFNITKENPELKNELKVLIEDNLPYAKPAFISRARKVLKALNF
ncbi:hypothetical protein [Chryseosolibacter indicus]|uniref:Adenylosuccinate lyase n=1 Tax=Chryseosolibacter indicus TaxID=2782351 RepID=A0ABS5VK09_9BACT|nr:hypothetical protein [Chryseosolibacter indicus]MBT1701721.1 hypothetical protein [Chryseosolibacter indicus]